MKITQKRVLVCAGVVAGALLAPRVVQAVLLRLTGTVVRDETHGR